MRIAFVGTGTMGRVLIRGLSGKGGGEHISIVAYDKNPNAMKDLPAGVEVLPVQQWRRKREPIDAIVIAVKPSDVSECLAEFGAWPARMRWKPLWISIAAGVSIATIQGVLGPRARICRVMPNTPCMAGEGFSAYCLSSGCGEADASIVKTIFTAVGVAVSVPEKLMNAVTGLSGSGPAYVFLFIEALIEAGMAVGLPSEISRAAALKTVAGAVELAQKSGEDVTELRRKVTSPGGTTARGLLTLEENRFKYAIVKAVCDAASRAEEMEKLSAQDSKKMDRTTMKGNAVFRKKKGARI